MLTAARFRPIRRRVFRETLVAAGFREQSGWYDRVTPTGQIHCAAFSSWEGLWVDLGWHFACAPPFAPPEQKVVPGTLTPPACFLQMRLRDDSSGQVFPYGETPDEAEHILYEVVGRCLSHFAALEVRWGDGASLLDTLPPERMHKDAEIFAALMRARTLAGQDRQSKRMYTRQLFPGWYPHIHPTCLLLAHLAWKHGRSVDLIRRYIEVGQHSSQGHVRNALTDQIAADLIAG